MSYFLELYTWSKTKIKVELDLPKYAVKTYLKSVTGVDTSDIAKKSDLANLKPDVYELDIDQLKNVPSGLDSLKNKVNKFRCC